MTPILNAIRVRVQAILDSIEERLPLVDTEAVALMLAAYLALRSPEDKKVPWINLIAAPGSGKTTAISILGGLPGMEVVSTITEAGFLSGVSARDSSPMSDGGLLNAAVNRRLGIAFKDISSIISAPSAKRGPVLAALRELDDGEWNRRLGTEGGLKRDWFGKLLVIAASTPAADRILRSYGELGERFFSLRLPVVRVGYDMIDTILGTGGSNSVARGFSAEFETLLPAILGSPTPEVSDHARRLLLDLATLIASGRSVVPRDPSHVLLDERVDPEGEGRVLKQLEGALYGLLKIGYCDREAFSLLRRFLVDGIPINRVSVLEYLFRTGPCDGRKIQAALNLTDRPCRDVLEDLVLLGLTDRTTEARGQIGYEYDLTPATRLRMQALDDFINSPAGPEVEVEVTPLLVAAPTPETLGIHVLPEPEERDVPALPVPVLEGDVHYEDDDEDEDRAGTRIGVKTWKRHWQVMGE